MGIKEFFVRAVIRVSRYTLHPPLWDAVTGWTCCNMTQRQEKKKSCYFWACFSLPLPFYTHIDTVTKTCCKNPPAHTQKVLYKHVTVTVVHGFTTDGVFYGEGGACKVWSIMTDKLKASTAKCHLKEKSSRVSAIIWLWWGCPPVCDVSTAAKNSPGKSHMGELQGQMRLGSWAYCSENCGMEDTGNVCGLLRQSRCGGNNSSCEVEIV